MGGVGSILHMKSQSAKICLNFNLGGGGILQLKNHKECSKSQDLPKFQFSGGGGGVNSNFLGGRYSATGKSQSAKICLNLNFRGGGGYSATEKSKCQDLHKFQLGGGGYSATEKSQSAKICLNFNFFGGGILQLKNHKVPRSA